MVDIINFNPVEREELAELVEELSSIRGRHTELVSVLVPADTNINVVIDQLEGEKSTARNIKSATTRKNVIEALEKVMRVLRMLNQKTPKNGIAVYSGNVSEVEGQINMSTWAIVPPEELNMRLYRCDQVFIVDALKEMLEAKEVYGLFVIERKEATVGLLEGKKIKVLQHLESGVPGKIRAGGQCISEDMLIETKDKTKRIADIKIGEEIEALDLNSEKVVLTKCINKWDKEKKEYLQIVLKDCWSVISSLDHAFFKEENDKIIEVLAKDLLVGDFLIANYSDGIKSLEIKEIIKINKKINLIDIETEAGNFFANGILVHNSAHRYERIIEGKAKDFFRECAEVLKKHFFGMKNLKGIIIGGPMPTKDDFVKEGLLVTALKDKIIGMKDIGYADEHGLGLLVEASQDLLVQQEITKEKALMETFFSMLGKQKDKVAYGLENVERAIRLASVKTLFLSKKLDKSLIKKLSDEAKSISADVEMISNETEEGQQFYHLSGIGAILRFSLEYHQ